jgi:hypothetical protein
VSEVFTDFQIQKRVEWLRELGPADSWYGHSAAIIEQLQSKLEGALGRALTAESQRDEAMTLLNAACEAAEANWKAKAIEAERGRIAAVDRLGEQSKLIDDYRNMSDRLRNELAQSSSRLDVLLKGERCKSAGEAGHWENCCDVCKAFVVERRNPLESCGMAAGADSNQLKPRDRQ